MMKCFLWRNKCFVRFHSNKFKKRIAIVSTKKWQGKVKEDLYLKNYLNHELVDAEIVCWEDNTIEWKSFDALIIRSIWGFQYELNSFFKWLAMIEKENVLILNPISVMKDNFDKEKQFSILDAYQIPHIDTIFFKNNQNLLEQIQYIKKQSFPNEHKLVLKPIISESGEDTYLLENVENLNNLEMVEKKRNIENWMLQPFIETVDEGEYSLCYIEGKFVNAILRYVPLFTAKNQVLSLEYQELDPLLIQLAENVIKIKEYKGYMYIRIDIVKHHGTYKIMEVELLDPSLFFIFIKDSKKRKYAFQSLSRALIKRIEMKENKEL